MKIVITGASGLLGSALAERLKQAGHQVAGYSMPRYDGKGTDEILPLDSSAFEGADAVVHLAGENVAGKWTAAKKRRIWNSRILGTQALAETLAGLDRPPRVLVSASATGAYGDRGDELLTEESARGRGFFADLTQEWEGATQPAKDAGIRVVLPRLGVVLAKGGGALARMLLPFKLGVGGMIGTGAQYWSWISLEDAVAFLMRALQEEDISGVYNLVSPQPLTNAEFTKTLGDVLHRPTLLPVPAFALRLVYGEMVDEALLSSVRVMPARLQQLGFQFNHPELRGALKAALQE